MFKPVKKGDTFKPNAKLTNETIKVINNFNSINGFRAGTKPKKTTNIEILVKPSGSLSIFTPVRITSLNSEALNDGNLFAKRAYKAYPASDNRKDHPLAILQNTGLDNNTLIKALLIGTTPAKINISDESHMYANTTNDGKFISVASGEVRILHKPDGTGEKWCTVILGGGGAGGGDTYKGYFKVIDISTPAVPAEGETPAQPAVAKIKIINGINADDINCFKGYINKIKKTIPIQEEITITAAGVLYLEFVPVGSKPITGFTCTFKQASELPAYDESKGFEQISQILFSDGKITDFSQPTGINSRIIYWGAC